MHEDAKLRDVIVAQGVTTDSSIIHQVFGGAVNYALIANFNLLEKAVNNARKLNMSVEVGNILCTDRFYNDYDDINGVFGDGKRSLNEKLVQYGILAVEMETAALYLLTAEAGVQGLGIFTVSDQLLTHERIPSHERETTFNDMVKIALETAIED